MIVDIEGTGKAAQIIKAGHALLDVEEVDRKPFIAFVPLPIPPSLTRTSDELCAAERQTVLLGRSSMPA